MRPRYGFRFSACALSLVITTLIAGCGGGGGGGDDDNQNIPPANVSENNNGNNNTPGSGSTNVGNLETFFSQNIQTNLNFCRTCHVPGGIGDTDLGRRFMLSSDSAQDYTNVKASWTRLGGGVESNAILVKNSDAKAGHSGGQSWPVGSKAYNDMATLFKCWDNPASCQPATLPSTSGGTTDNSNQLPLLEMGQKKSPLSAGCEGKPDDFPMPKDPRSLVVEGVNKPGVAVQFNGYWEDLHDPLPPYRKNKYERAKTCGEWRAQVKAGEEYIMTESSFFGGTRLFSTNVYNELWKSWGLKERPANYDEEIIRRYGFAPAPFRNPYPLPGEDPNLTNGGSGQLPLGMVMVKHPVTRQYTGEVTISCSSCHDSQLGDQFVWGRGTSTFDVGLLLNDASKRSLGLPALLPFPFSSGAGMSNALGVIDALFVLFDPETLDLHIGVELFPFHGSAGQVKTPNWWTRGWMTRLWHGALTGDHVRSSEALSVPNFMQTGDQRRANEADFENVHAFLNSMAPPAFPYQDQIDTKLAEAGAVLFHTKDLWANGANSNIPKQAGNGSCASCHGVYSPRYANDPTMLPDPRLKGIAGVITPIETIRTDKARLNVMSHDMKRAWNTSWWGYDDLHPEWTEEGQGRRGTSRERMKNNLALENTRLVGPGKWSEINGYSAPPMYGVWASAPYLHNGSVPTIWGVLKPSDRPKIWQSPTNPPLAPGLNHQIDTSYASYDFDHLGFKYTEIPCRQGTQIFRCNPSGGVDSFFSLLSALGSNIWLTYQAMPPFTDRDLEARRTTNTYEYSRGNGGHDFTQALTDQERYALIEYLKTL